MWVPSALFAQQPPLMETAVFLPPCFHWFKVLRGRYTTPDLSDSHDKTAQMHLKGVFLSTDQNRGLSSFLWLTNLLLPHASTLQWQKEVVFLDSPKLVMYHKWWGGGRLCTYTLSTGPLSNKPPFSHLNFNSAIFRHSHMITEWNIVFSKNICCCLVLFPGGGPD